MKKLLFVCVFLSVGQLITAQTSDTNSLKRNIFTTYGALKKKMKENNVDSLFYIDSTFNYSLKVPAWLELVETGSATMFGGTLPVVKEIKDAIVVTGIPLEKYNSFEDFKDVYLTGNKFGQPTKFSNEHIWYGQKEPISVENGVKQQVFLFWRGKIYYHMFVLLQTKTAYLLIQFTATPKTYDANISKFEEFMSGFKVSTK